MLTWVVAIPVLPAGSALAEEAQKPRVVWQMLESGTTASLRGIDSVDGKVAWASGTEGTVLKTIDGGAHWATCTVPDGEKDGATLDFRGVQGWDAATAIVMASGPGDKSRLYKTTDGCKSWNLLFKNPDTPNGFFDSFWFNGPRGILLGDPVRDKFAVFRTSNGGKTWKREPQEGLLLHGRNLAGFAASNSSVPRGNRLFVWAFATGGKSGATLFSRLKEPEDEGATGLLGKTLRKKADWKSNRIAVGTEAESSGVFSISYRYPVTTGICQDCSFGENARFIAVGGDYLKPNDSAGTAASSSDGGWTWTVAATPPHGYRSAVQWSASEKFWIAAGTNGSDISRDDGKTWQPLDEGNWNALSLPFIVGPKGRIARLNPAAIPQAAK